MDRKDGSVHFHIKWTQIPLLDWERFNTGVEAEAAAKKLARTGETYTVEERGEGCQRCRDGRESEVHARHHTTLSRTRVMFNIRNSHRLHGPIWH